MSSDRPIHNPRKRWLTIVSVIFLFTALAYGAWWYIYASHYESTDDAYVHGNLIPINSRVSGTVTFIHGDDTVLVEAGELIAELDTEDLQLALEQAQANLAQVVRQTQTLYTRNHALDAEVSLAESKLRAARTTLEKTSSDYQRRQRLQKGGGISHEEFEHARANYLEAQTAVSQAEAAIAVAQAQRAVNANLTHGVELNEHPDILKAASEVRTQWLALQRSQIFAPVSGMLAQRSVQIGQELNRGSKLFSLVPLDEVWVEANFKENQLSLVHPGQHVTLESDYYGSKVSYHGIVEGISAGTGGAFALLPAQNASGNWIKVVQRVPVRIRLDPTELRDNPLRVGLSMSVTVDTASQSDRTLPPPSSRAHRVNDISLDPINQEIQAIIVANSGVANYHQDAS